VVTLALDTVWQVLAGVPDPELPAISITELAIVRDVQLNDDVVRVTVTPTYGGCPATDVIREDIHAALIAAGAREVEISITLTPAWSTDWLSDDTKAKLKRHGIAPPGTLAPGVKPITFHPRIRCPRCDSTRTEEISAFGATACKALHRCLACLEPFEYFKPI
jgi:ring-1,2-phenylacetyl-CoA epoxidase subunit PaaD